MANTRPSSPRNRLCNSIAVSESRARRGWVLSCRSGWRAGRGHPSARRPRCDTTTSNLETDKPTKQCRRQANHPYVSAGSALGPPRILGLPILDDAAFKFGKSHARDSFVFYYVFVGIGVAVAYGN